EAQLPANAPGSQRQDGDAQEDETHQADEEAPQGIRRRAVGRGSGRPRRRRPSLAGGGSCGERSGHTPSPPPISSSAARAGTSAATRGSTEIAGRLGATGT